MSDSTPCIVCGRTLSRATDDYEAQPDDGVMFSTHGNYGSTVFDPMNGTTLLINVCDECIVEAGKKGRVLSGKDYMPVQTDIWIDGGEGSAFGTPRFVKSIVGSKRVERALVAWNAEVADDNSMEYLPIEHVAEWFDELMADDAYHWNLGKDGMERLVAEGREHGAA